MEWLEIRILLQMVWKMFNLQLTWQNYGMGMQNTATNGLECFQYTTPLAML
jgi:hypothetical protein